MADMWDIARHVESNPDDREQRWRLAKKLYMSWEYRLALEHLQILTNEEPDKLNMRRYLAATYFRLGRYNEATSELVAIIETWPEEVAVQEQYARALEVSGRKLESADVWEDIAQRVPDHPLAERAAKRLRRRGGIIDTPMEELKLTDSDSGIDISHGITCPACGVQNSAEFKRCWQCHSILTPTITPAPALVEKKEIKIDPFTLNLSVGLGIVALLSAGIYLSLRGLKFSQLVESGQVAPSGLTHFFMAEFTTTHILIGLVCVVAWPLCLRLAFMLLHPEGATDNALNVLGLFLASSSFALSWIPGLFFFLWPGVGAVLSLLAVIVLLKVSWKRGLGIWFIQGTLVFFVGLCSFLMLEGFGFLADIPVLAKYASEGDSTRGEGLRWGPLKVPMTLSFQFSPSGSKWLDEHANRAAFEVISPEVQPSVTVELRRATEADDPKAIIDYKRLMTKKITLMGESFSPAQPYELVLSGEKGLEVEIVVRSVLRPRLGKGSKGVAQH